MSNGKIKIIWVKFTAGREWHLKHKVIQFDIQYLAFIIPKMFYSPFALKYRSASSAAIQPLPAAVTAWR